MGANFRQQCELAEMTYPRFRQLAAEESEPRVPNWQLSSPRVWIARNRKLGDLAFVDVITGRAAHAIMDLCGRTRRDDPS